MKYRYCRELKPSQRDVVKCRVVDVNINSGVNVTLIDYDDIPGFVPISQYIRNIRRSKKVANKGDEVILEVSEVTDELTVLTKMNIRKSEIILAGRRHKLYHKLGVIANDIFVILRRQMGLYNDENKDDEEFLSNIELCKKEISEYIIWDNVEKYFNGSKTDNDIYDDMVSHMQTIDTCKQQPQFVPIHFPELITIPGTTMEQVNTMLNDVIAQSFRDRIITEPGIREVPFTMMTYNDDGASSIKKILLSLNLKYDDIEVYSLTSPKYILQITGIDSKHMTQQLNGSLEFLKEKCGDDYDLQTDTVKDINVMSIKYNHLLRCDL
jgi:translation initiation factor 2 alpha subunit (eIF-2alpha)